MNNIFPARNFRVTSGVRKRDLFQLNIEMPERLQWTARLRLLESGARKKR